MKKVILTFAGIELGFYLVNKLAEKILPLIQNYFVKTCTLQGTLALYAILCLVLLKKTNVLKFRLTGFGTGLAVGAYILVVNIALPTAAYLLSLFTGVGSIGQPITVSAGELLLFALFMLFIGITEEVLYRGILQNTVLEYTGADAVSSVQKGIVITGILFGAVHLGNLLSGESLTAVLFQVVDAIPVGIILGAVYFRSKNNLWVCVLLHALTDAAGLLIAGLLSGASVTEGLDNLGAQKLGNSSAGHIIIFAITLSAAIYVIRKSVIQKAIAAREAVA